MNSYRTKFSLEYPRAVAEAPLYRMTESHFFRVKMQILKPKKSAYNYKHFPPQRLFLGDSGGL